jgi:hypothetical protein
MAATCGRLEASVVIPAGGWAVAVNDGSAYNATVAAGTYSGPTAVLAALVVSLNAAALAAGSARTWTGSIASGEQGTGKTTLTCSAGANVTLNWTSTNLRNLLGWAANLSGAITFTSPSGCLGLFLPDCPISQPFPLADLGNHEADVSQTSSPLGVVHTIRTVSRLRHPGIAWSHVTLARARQSQEANGVRSWERFVRDCLIGTTGLSYLGPGCKVTVWPDAATAGTSQQYHSNAPRSVSEAMEPSTGDGYLGLYRCRWPGGVAV